MWWLQATTPGRIPSVTHAELERLQPSHLVVIGGPRTVSIAVRQSLAGYLRTDRSGSGEADVDL